MSDRPEREGIVPLTPATSDTTFPARPVRRLPAVDCTTPLPIKYISGPPFPSWATAPDRPADERGPAVSSVYLDPDDPDGLNLLRGLAWCAVMWVIVSTLFVAWWVAIR